MLMKNKNIKTKRDFANAIHVKYSYLTYILYKTDITNLYSTFDIPKKNDGCRTILAPRNPLKKIQKNIANLLWDNYSESHKTLKKKNRKIPSISHGFIKGKSIITNAQKHRNKKIVLNVDLENFFDSFHFGRIRGFFIKNNNFKFPEDVATMLAQLVCYNGVLPQGAPSSPIITNLICEILDYRIVKLAKKYRVTYTRYADDLTFSSNERSFDEKIPTFIEELTKIIQRSGFKINSTKTHFSNRSQRQVVTGLVVNRKINVKREYYKNTRAMAYNLYKNNVFYIDNKSNLGTIRQLEGRFAHIYNIERYNNYLVYRKSLSKNNIEYQKNLFSNKITLKGHNSFYYSILLRDPDINNKYYSSKHQKFFLPKDFFTYFLNNKDDYIKYFSSKELEYQKFLFYINFFGNYYPTIVCEGKTDSRYLKSALKKMHKDYPNLIGYDGKKYDFKINFFNRSSKTIQYLFNVSEGGGHNLIHLYDFFSNIKPNPKKTKDLTDLRKNYLDYFTELTNQNAKSPTIFLFDNEGSGHPLSNFIRHVDREDTVKIKPNEIENQRLEMYNKRVKKSIFILSTPKEKNEDKSDIESLLYKDDIPILSEREFTREENFDPQKFYGKNELSNYVQQNYKSINFDKLKPLLDKLNEYVTLYNKELQVVKKL